MPFQFFLLPLLPVSRHTLADLVKSTVQFRNVNISTYTTLLVDGGRNQLLVGSRDVVFRLNLTDLSLLQALNIQPSNERQAICKTRWQQSVWAWLFQT